MSRLTQTSAHAQAVFDEWGLPELKTGAAAADTGRGTWIYLRQQKNQSSLASQRARGSRVRKIWAYVPVKVAPPQLKLFALQGSPERLVVSAGEASGVIKLSPNAIAEVRSQSG